MNRIMIIGCCGAGKSTFARKLNIHLGYELIHLDRLYWKKNWERPNSEDWIRILKKELKKEKWIMDGHYNSTLEIRMKRADTIIFLDYPRFTCLWNVFKRTMKEKVFKIKRDDIIEGCAERFDLSFYKWIWNYNKLNRIRYLNILNKLKKKKEVIIFKNYEDSEKFLFHLANRQRISLMN